MKKIILLLLLIPCLAYAETALIGSQWKQIDTTLYPADDITSIDISGMSNYTGFPSSAASTSTQYAILQDKKNQNTAGGGCTSGSWVTRTVNTEVFDTGNFVNISSNNQFILSSGNYNYRSISKVHSVDRNQARVFDITDNGLEFLGLSNNSNAAASITNNAIVFGQITTSTNKVFELQHRCQTTKATNGFGVESNFDDEIYTIIYLEKTQ